MRATILQTNTVWGKPSDNQQNAEVLLCQAPKSDLYILPEMWSTGFATSPEGIAEEEDYCSSHGSLAWMKSMARKHDAAICGSLSVKTDGGKFVNRSYFVYPDGRVVHYDKKHLFFAGGEHKSYTAGTRRVVAEYKGVRFLLLICYDLRFPVWSRNDRDYDAIIYVANWPTPREEVWSTLLKARAIENQCFVLGANRVGTDDQCSYTGASAIVSPYGKVIAYGGSGEGWTSAELDIEKLEKFRKTFPLLDDKDEFCIREKSL